MAFEMKGVWGLKMKLFCKRSSKRENVKVNQSRKCKKWFEIERRIKKKIEIDQTRTVSQWQVAIGHEWKHRFIPTWDKSSMGMCKCLCAQDPTKNNNKSIKKKKGFGEPEKERKRKSGILLFFWKTFTFPSAEPVVREAATQPDATWPCTERATSTLTIA